MRRVILSLAGLFFIAFSGVFCQLWAKDFADMTFRELFIYRSTVTNAPAAEQQAFRMEWEKRLQSMTAEEKEQVEMYERKNNFPNPYVQGGGYGSQGTNSAIFENDSRGRRERAGEDE